jgi:hypothetical protein
MAFEFPSPSEFTGLSRKAMEFCTVFGGLIAKGKHGLTEADWAPLETMIDPAAFQRTGRFGSEATETIDWPTYKSYVGKYACGADWHGRLRRITEGPDVVIQELEERYTRGGETDVVHTAAIYHFDAAGRIDHLDVYINNLPHWPG